MRGSVRLGLSVLGSLALVLFLTRFEKTGSLTLIFLEVAGSGALAGLLGRSASLSALGSLVGGLAGTYLAVSMGVPLWNPSPTPSDLLIIRLFMLGGIAAVAAVVGYIARVRPRERVKDESVESPGIKQPIAEKKPTLETKIVQEPEIEPATTVESKASSEYIEVQTRICKFCLNVIPAESVFCPMCGNKLVEV
jgi:hypothetical protein